MTRKVEAVYENGALHPLEPLPLDEHQTVSVTVSDFAVAGPTGLDLDYIERAKQEVAGITRIPTLEEVQQRLSKIPGSLSDAITAERGDR